MLAGSPLNQLPRKRRDACAQLGAKAPSKNGDVRICGRGEEENSEPAAGGLRGGGPGGVPAGGGGHGAAGQAEGNKLYRPECDLLGALLAPNC